MLTAVMVGILAGAVVLGLELLVLFFWTKRIRELENTIWIMHDEAHAHIKQIEEQKSLLRDFIAGDATVLE